MFNLFNWMQNFIYSIMDSEFWLFNPIDLGPFGYIAPISMLGIGSLIAFAIYVIIRSLL